MKIILTGRPITKKNHQIAFAMKAIVFLGSRLHCPKCYAPLKVSFNLLQSKQYREYEKDCLQQLMVFKLNNKLSKLVPPFEGKCQVKCLYWMDSNRGKPDLIGLLQSTQDILEKGFIVTNDELVRSTDGSRIMGVDKINPRVEIEIEEFLEDSR